MTDNIFSVYQFFADESHERVRHSVSAEEAVNVAQHYTSCVAARMGIVQRVIIVDDNDDTNFEWKYGEGVTFPPQQEKTDGK